ncbi:MAG: hypothetical protein GF353_12790 [Candidatus Lokiarchaeota archaeon]|nr:hypothetical protein [Candidatus Lokiarchaeota archaeon]
MSKLKTKKVVIFKHGVSFFIREGKLKGNGNFELEFRIDEMNDILKSLFVLDTSEKGFISSISYDAALETSQLLKSIMLDIPNQDSFSSLVMQIKGAQAKLSIGTSEKVQGTIMGIEYLEKTIKEGKITEKLLVLLKDNSIIVKLPFSEITSFEILNEDLKKDLKFFLDTVIAGKKKDAKKIVINCESGGDDTLERSIMVSYIRESPVWKTSYRIIISKKQAQEQIALLSGWCLVENVTNDDWEDIELSLVAGMPVSFIYDFYRPIYIQRTKIEPPKVLSARPTEIEEGVATESYKEYEAEMDLAMAPSPKRALKRKAEAKPPPSPGARAALTTAFAADMDDSTLYDKVKSQTATSTKDLGELFEYNISNPVSIKRKQSALVPILTEQLKAKRILLYNKNEMGKNPNACLEITNNTSLTLERGPVTIIYDNNLAGEAILPFLNKEDVRILNYAVEQAVVVNHEQKTQNQSIHRISVSGAYIYDYYYTDLTTIYKIKNKTQEEKELYLDHPKMAGYEIKESPIDPEETANYWRFKIKVQAKEAISFKIRERRENYSSYYIYNYSKDDLLKRVAFYVRQKFIDERIENQLTEIGELIGKKNELTTKKSKLEEERYQMTQEQDRLRENITVLGDSTQETKLKEKYVQKLSDQENRFENISEEIEKVDKEIKLLDKQIEEKINNLKVK